MSEDPNQEKLEYAWRRLAKAKMRMNDVQDRIKSPNEDIDDEAEVKESNISLHIDNIVMDCQYIIELSTKSMFKIVGKKFPKKHGLSFKDGKTQGFIREVPNDFPYADKVPRAVFLTTFWNQFYQLSKYGAPEINEDAEAILHEKDAERAIEDANFCLSLAQYLLDHIIKHSDLADPRPDPSDTNFKFTIDPYSLSYE